MSYELLVPGPRGAKLRGAILGAIDRVYSENVERFDADGIGDDTTVFGITVSRNLWHVIELAVKDIAGVEARRASNTFFLEIDCAYELCFCKAPPGARSVNVLNFDDSHVRSRIIARNGSHLQLRLDLDGGTPLGLAEHAAAPFAVVAHFGDHEHGFSHAVIGAPYRLEGGEFGWEWQQPFTDEATGAREETAAVRGPSPDPDRGGFGLTLRDDRDAAEQA